MSKKKLAGILAVVILLLPSLSLALTLDQMALRGLKGVHVLVLDTGQAIKCVGLTQDQIQTDVQLRLRKSGIKVMNKEEVLITPGNPNLCVTLFAYSIGKETYAYSINVMLYEQVTLARGFKSLATIWFNGWVGGVFASNGNYIRGTVGDLLDKFINDYLAANPKK